MSEEPQSVTFKDRYRDLQHLARELDLVREHNRRFRPGDDQAKLLLFAEASLCLLTIERFLRVILLPDATKDHTLSNLLDMALSKKRNLVELGVDDVSDAKQRIRDVRNSIAHGNFEQAAEQAGCDSVRDYFGTVFASEVEELFQILDGLMMQIDPATGRRRGSNRK